MCCVTLTNVFTVCMSQEGERLKNIKERLDEENKTLRSEKEMNALVIQKKVSQSQQHKQIIKEVTVEFLFQISQSLEQLW